MLNDRDITQVSKLLGETLNNIPSAEVKWLEFGMELLSKDDGNVLSSIKKECPWSLTDRCQRLLTYWKSVKAIEGDGWNRVIEALNAVDLTAPANKLASALKNLKQNPEQPPKNEPSQASEGKQHQTFVYIIFWVNCYLNR